jgi:hypothetical protein
MTSKSSGHSRRQFLRGALAAAASGSLLRTFTAFTSESPKPVAELWIGTATADITPKSKVNRNRLPRVQRAQATTSGLTANVLAFESRDAGRVTDHAILISCDLCTIDVEIVEGFRKHVADRLPGFDIDRLFLIPAYAYSAPVLLKPRYLDEPPFTGPKDYLPLMYDRITEAVVKAWECRAAQTLIRGRGKALVGDNCRFLHPDGQSPMSGHTKAPLLGDSEDSHEYAFEIVCVCDDKQQMKAAVITVAGISPMPQGDTIGIAEFWHDTCRLLRGRYGRELCVLGSFDPARDGCSHSSYRRTSQSHPNQLRAATRTQSVGHGIGHPFCHVAEASSKDIREDVPRHDRISQIAPTTQIDPYAELARLPNLDPRIDRLYPGIEALHVALFRRQVCAMEFNVFGLGDVAIVDDQVPF